MAGVSCAMAVHESGRSSEVIQVCCMKVKQEVVGPATFLLLFLSSVRGRAADGEDWSGFDMDSI